MPPTLQLLPKSSQRALNHFIDRAVDLVATPAGNSAQQPDSAALVEFQSPSAAILSMPLPAGARNTIRMVASMFAVAVAAMGVIPVDRVVVARAKVITVAPTLVVQPLETSIVRSIEVHEGQVVHAGDLLARLDPTFAAADAKTVNGQVMALEAEVARLKAESEDRDFTIPSDDPAWTTQKTLFDQRHAEHNFKLENYAQKITALEAVTTRSQQDADSARQRLQIARQIEGMRKQLERSGYGSKLNTLTVTSNRIEVEGQLAQALNAVEAGQRDLAAMKAERDGDNQQWHADVSQKLAERSQALNEAQESLNKAGRRHELTELRAQSDATVLTVAKTSVGSVLQSGDQFITLAPSATPLELEANIPGNHDGFVKVGDTVAVKFDSLPFSHYGMAYGKVRTISADSFTPQDEARSRSGWASSVPMPAGTVEPYYRSRITIDRLALRNLPSDFQLTPGMPVTADIKIGKRTVLSYLLGDVLRVTSEGMREP